MKIDDLTIGEAKALAKTFGGTATISIPANDAREMFMTAANKLIWDNPDA